MAEATNSILGEIKLTGDLSGNGGAQVGSNPQLSYISGLTPGQYDIANITVDTKGRIVDIEGASSAQISALIPDATSTIKGKVSVGANLYVNGYPTSGYQIANFNGVLLTSTPTSFCPTATYNFYIKIDGSTNLFYFTGSDLGSTVQDLITYINSQSPNTTVSLNTGNIKVESAISGSASTIDMLDAAVFSCMSGFVQFDTPVDGASACEIYVKPGSSSDFGVVKIGDGIQVIDGVISINLSTLPIATTTTTGVVKVPASGNLDVDVLGAISVPIATSSVLGVVKSGSGISIDSNGSLSLNFSTAVATSSVLGAVKVPTSGNLVVDGAGALSVPIATSSVLGVVKSGTGTSIDGAGALSVPIATTNSLGVIKVGSGLSIDGNGVLSTSGSGIPDATYSSKGVVQINSSYLTINSGILSVNVASSSQMGVLRVPTTSYLSSTAGVLSLSSLVAKTNLTQTYTKAQVVASSAVSGSSVTPNLSDANVFVWTLTANSTLNNPTNNVSGGTYLFVINQDATGSRTLTFGSNYKFAGPKLISSTASSSSVVSCVSDGTYLYCVMNIGF